MPNKVYIKVLEEGPWPKTPWFIEVLSIFTPAANPDFDELYTQVRVWLLEVSIPEGLPCREIGLNERMEPLVAAPIGRNYGVWVDGPEKIDWPEYETVDAELFSRSWHKVECALTYKHKRTGA